MAGELQLRAADGRVFTISAPMRIGRDNTCDLRLDDGLVSRVHATVWPEGSALRVRDEGSSNGTFFNEERLEAGRVYNMRAGDTLRVGHATLLVERAPLTAGAAAPNLAAAVPVPPPPTAAERAAPDSPPTMHMPVQPPPPPPARPALAAPAQRRSSLPTVLVSGCLVVCLVLVCGGGGFFAMQRPPVVQTALAGLLPGTPAAEGTLAPEEIHLTLLPSVPAPTPLPPEAFAANGQSLAAAVAALNSAELDFIHKALAIAQAPGGRLSRPLGQSNLITEDDFALIEHNALKVAVLAQQQGQTVAAQGGGNDPAVEALAGVYATLAQQGFALVVKVDDMRRSWLEGALGMTELASLMAQYSAAVWNPAVTEPVAAGNPFAAYTSDPAAVANPQPVDPAALASLLDPSQSLGWVAAAPAGDTETLALPPILTMPPAVIDTERMAALLGASDPPDPNVLAPVAVGFLSLLTSNSPDSVTLPKQPVVVTNPQEPGGQGLMAYAGGQAALITAPENAAATALTGSLLGIDGNHSPSVAGQTSIQAAQPLVALTLSNLVIKAVNRRPKDAFNTFEADVQYEFDVAWQTNLVAPQFALECVSGNHFDITAVAGQQHVNAKGLLILYPGNEDAYCYASRNGNTLGSASLHFLVGDAAEATQRAVQVETDSVSLDLTLTADGLGTLAGKLTNEASTRSVEQTSNAVGTEVAGTQTAEFIMTVTALAGNADRFATETAAALTGDADGDGVANANDRCADQAETDNDYRDEDGCPDALPNVTLSGSFTEILTGGPVGAFGSTATVNINFAAGTMGGTASGAGSWTAEYICFNTSDPSEVYQTVTGNYSASYTGSLTGSANAGSRTYNGTISANGTTRATTSAFTHDECTHLNGTSTTVDIWSGSGSVSGTWDGDAVATLTTNWNVDTVKFAGTLTGAAALSEP